MERLARLGVVRGGAESALDIGCGTGLSSVALLALARSVYGLDRSLSMLRNAQPHPAVHYCAGEAVHLPFADEAFDLLTMSSVLHWMNRRLAVAEVHRVMKIGGWLIVSDNLFTGRLAEEHALETWFRNIVRRFPSPPRTPVAFDPATARNDGFNLIAHEDYEHTLPMSQDDFIGYVLSMSNITTAIERGETTGERLNAFMKTATDGYFAARVKGTFIFRGTIWCLRKEESPTST